MPDPKPTCSLPHVKHRIFIERCYDTPSKKHHALGLAPFNKSGCTKAVHSTHENMEFHLDNGTKLTLQITLISNSLDSVSFEITPPASHYFSNKNNKEDIMAPQSN